MIAYIAYLICTNTMPGNHAACTTAIKALAIQSGVQSYSDAFDQKAQGYARRQLASVDDRILGSLYIFYQFQIKDAVNLPIPWHPISDSFNIYASHHSLGVSLGWTY